MQSIKSSMKCKQIENNQFFKINFTFKILRNYKNFKNNALNL